jgi:phosphatidylserine/phosphatidylglycerophosphate/cardiolipin synthase-like enzyme
MSMVGVSRAELEALARRIERGELSCPLDPDRPSLAGLAARGPSLFGHSREATLAIIAGVLAERGAPRPSLELVWTGPDVTAGAARDTAVVVRELFARAQRHVLVAGYAFDHGEEILRPLHEAMRDRGVEVELYIDVPRAESADAAEGHLVRYVDDFCRRNWPFGPPLPRLYHDPRTVWGDDYASIHAKCVVVDGRRTLIGSANFTGRGHERNVEVGVVIDDAELAERLIHQWRQLVANDRFRRCL